jgi:glycine dehydrogenase
MLSKLGYSSMEDFVRDTIPPAIRVSSDVISDETIIPLSESELFKRAKALGAGNTSMRSYIGMGYHNAVVPPVILRNVSSALCVITEA